MTANRAISADEIAVIRAALVSAVVDPAYSRLAGALDGLRVIDRCDCGCDSVDFARPGSEAQPVPIADGAGLTPAGGRVGVIVWGTATDVTGLEVYDLGAGDDDLRLPVPASIEAW